MRDHSGLSLLHGCLNTAALFFFYSLAVSSFEDNGPGKPTNPTGLCASCLSSLSVFVASLFKYCYQAFGGLWHL
jgi:hypothetical protein